jgi:hypothetical protein
MSALKKSNPLAYSLSLRMLPNFGAIIPPPTPWYDKGDEEIEREKTKTQSHV